MPPAPLVFELIPCPDPWEVAQKLAHLPGLLFLDSSERGGERGRYSYVMALPRFEEWTGRVTDVPDWFASPGPFQPSAHPSLDGLPPFRGGVAGLFGYHLSRQVERLPPSRYDELKRPIARCDFTTA